MLPCSISIKSLICWNLFWFQGDIVGHMEMLVSHMVRWVSTVGFDADVQARALGCLVSLATLNRSLLSGGTCLSA